MIRTTNDGMGRRYQKTVYSDWNGSAYGTTNVTKYVWDSWLLLAELDDDNDVSSYNVWGLDLSSTLSGAGGVGGLLAVVDQGTNYLYTYDGNGNVVDVMDDEGTSVAHYEYDPFGRTVAKSGTFADDNHWRFSTKSQDENGLYYYGYRYYSPELGRWPSRDPIEEAGGKHLYKFLRNSSVNGVDLLGLTDDGSAGPPWDVLVSLVLQVFSEIIQSFNTDVWTRDVTCPTCCSRHLLHKQNVTERDYWTGSIFGAEGDYGTQPVQLWSIAMLQRKQKEVVKVYGCCVNLWGMNATPWQNGSKTEETDPVIDDIGSVSGLGTTLYVARLKTWTRTSTSVATRSCRQDCGFVTELCKLNGEEVPCSWMPELLSAP